MSQFIARFLLWFVVGALGSWFVVLITNAPLAISAGPNVVQSILLALIGAGVWRRPSPSPPALAEE